MSRLLLILLISLVRLCLCQLQSCYNTDHTLAPDNFPCDSTSPTSACCPGNFTCDTSLYCLTQTNEQWIGSCTDQSFQNKACPLTLNRSHLMIFRPNVLTRSSADITDPGNFESPFFSFSNNVTESDYESDSGDTIVCSGPNNTACCTNQNGYTVTTFANTAIIPLSTSGLPTYYASGGFSVSGVAASSTASMSSPSSTASPTSSASLAKPTSKATTSPSPSPSSSSAGLSKGASAGVGIGAALGALFIGAAVLYVIYRRKKSRALNMQQRGHDQQRGYSLGPSDITSEDKRTPLSTDLDGMMSRDRIHEI